MSQGKLKSLAQMFTAWPSFQPSAGRFREMMETFLDVLRIYSDDDVEAACRAITRQAREFPPSAGEIRAECERIVVGRAPRKSMAVPPRPIELLTADEKAAAKARVAALVKEFKAGAPKDAAPVSQSQRRKRGPVQIGAGLAAALGELARGE